MVRIIGIEPICISATVFETALYAYSSISAYFVNNIVAMTEFHGILH